MTNALNYHHLHYFWLVAREGGVGRAAAHLGVAHPTVSAQVHALEQALGERLLERRGRSLVLTEMGKVVFGFAEQIFSLGRDLLDTVEGRPARGPARFVVGVGPSVPKLVAAQLLSPVATGVARMRLVCREEGLSALFAGLAAHELDLVLSDTPLPSGSGVRAFSHLLGACGVSFLATPELARRYRKKFPGSLAGAPVLLPTTTAAMRRTLDSWFELNDLHPSVEAEFDDTALLKMVGRNGVGLFPVPSAIEAAAKTQFGVELVGRLPDVRESFYAVSIERRIRHPGVAAICRAAQLDLPWS